ncbi:MAG: hypothetical protein ABIH23_16685, partial [bacterium]
MNRPPRINKILRHLFGVTLIAVLTLPASAKTSELLNYIPEDVVYCRIWDATNGTPKKPGLPNFEQSLDEWVEALDDILEWRILKQELNSLRSSLNVPEDLSLWDLFTGERSAVAVLGLGDGVGLRIPSVLVITQPTDMERAKAVLHGLFESIQSYGVPVTRDTRQYEDSLIESLEISTGIPGLGLSFVTRDDLLFLCTNGPVLDRVLDIAMDERGYLAEDPDFIALQKELPQQYDEISYVNWTRIIGVVNELKKATAFIPEKDGRAIVESVADQVSGLLGLVRAHASTRVWDGNTRKIVGRTLLSTDRPEALRSWVSSQPVTFPLIRMAPRKTESVLATNLYPIPEVWKTVWAIIDSLGPQGEMIRKTSADFQTQFGIDIQGDLLSWMGPGCGFIKFAIDLESVIPINHFALWIETTEEE